MNIEDYREYCLSLGEDTHLRFIVDRAQFMKKIEA